MKRFFVYTQLLRLYIWKNIQTVWAFLRDDDCYYSFFPRSSRHWYTRLLSLLALGFTAATILGAVFLIFLALIFISKEAEARAWWINIFLLPLASVCLFVGAQRINKKIFSKTQEEIEGEVTSRQRERRILFEKEQLSGVIDSAICENKKAIVTSKL